MAITIIVTNAGRAALVNAANTGTNAVTITQLGITATAFAADPAQVALPGEIKRIASVAGVVVADDAIHVTASDVTTDAYTMRGFALYLADGTLFALYGQAGAILNKTAESMMLLAADIAFADIDATMIEFGDTNFILPPATTEILGLVELATTAEGQAGSDNSRVLTPYVGKQSVLGWLLSQDGAGSGLDADLLDGLHASAFALAGHTHGTMATQNANAVAITGGTLGNVSVGVVDGTAGAPGLFWNADPDVGLFRAGANALGVATAGAERMRIGPDGKVTLNGATPNYLFNAASSNPARGILADVANIAAADLNGAMLSFTQNTINNWCIGQAPGVDAFAFYRGRNGAADGIEIARFAASGNFGIGTTTPGARLQVAGTGGSSVISLLETGVRNWAIRSGGAATNIFDIADLTAGATRFAINSAGNVGIGTAMPGTPLHVVGGSGQFATFGNANARGTGNSYFGITDATGRKAFFGYGGNNDDLHIMNEVAGRLGFGTNGAFRWVISQSGDFEPNAGEAYDIGSSGMRIRSGHFGTSVQIAGNAAWHAGNDGSGSGLDADLLDGFHASYFLPAATFSAAEILSRLLTVDGPGSGLNADLLDGLQASDFLQIAAASVLQNGYIAFSNGLKIIWGRVSVSMDSYSNVTYPISFDTVPTPVFPTIDQIGTASQQNTLLASSTISGFSIYQAGDISGSLPYHVIGK
ncbi:phage tail protein [Sphingopyxis sp. NFH-91]|uniref:phage tail protein n=1 Tax=Sphingopyxis sp. NFH-91 TaxID=2744457 RepID=UPI001F344216|nr:phage tail protein [Sphingopyxis sp. NFH-91]